MAIMSRLTPPIQTLPPELLCSILLEASDLSILPAASVDEIIRFSLVCRMWHGIIMREPRFWTSFGFRVRGDADLEKMVPSIERLYSRSGNLPLQLGLFTYRSSFPTDCSRLDILILSCDRWRLLNLRFLRKAQWPIPLFQAAIEKRKTTGFDCFGNVEELMVQLRMDDAPSPETKTPDTPPICDVFPNLQKLHLGTLDALRVSALLSHLSFSCLTYLEISDDIGMQDEPLLHGILSRIPTLQRLELEVRLIYADSPLLPPHRINHPSLKDLWIEDLMLADGQLSTIHCPAIEALWIGGPRFDPDDIELEHGANILRNVPQMVGTQLNRFCLNAVPASDNDLANVLAALPTLRFLYLKFAYFEFGVTFHGEFLGLLLRRSKFGVVLPHLAQFVLTQDATYDQFAEPQPEENFDYDAFVAFVEDPRRWWASPNLDVTLGTKFMDLGEGTVGERRDSTEIIGCGGNALSSSTDLSSAPQFEPNNPNHFQAGSAHGRYALLQTAVLNTVRYGCYSRGPLPEDL